MEGVLPNPLGRQCRVLIVREGFIGSRTKVAAGIRCVWHGRSLLYSYVQDRNHRSPELWKALCACVDLLAPFREIHIGYADRYIFCQHHPHASNSTAEGTGGTPCMTDLNKHLEKTKRFVRE